MACALSRLKPLLACSVVLSLTFWSVISQFASGAEPGDSAQPGTSSDQLELTQVAQWLQNLPEPARRGYRHLTELKYLPSDLDEEVFAELVARSANTPPTLTNASLLPDMAADRSATFWRYGLTNRPGDATGRPLQYVVDSQNRWIMNCFACHGGSVYGQTLPGAPNNLYQLQTFTEDIRSAKLKLSKPLTHMDLGSMVMPLGSSVGTTNAVMFGVALMNYRDAELNVHPFRPAPHMVHHDMDPPAWWLFHRKTRLYADGFAQKGVRGLMQFMLVRENGPEQFKAWEKDFEEIYAFIESLRPPRYQGPIDAALVNSGRVAFNSHCARCHGEYATPSQSQALGSWQHTYPEKLVPIDEIGTDRVRLDSLSEVHRQSYGASWFAYFGEQATWAQPDGYMAPPLDGIWASAPYFHNGSVPTLWHVLHPEQRPTLWRRTALEMDTQRVGLQVEELAELPPGLSNRARRQYFDTRAAGKSQAGHDFPSELTEPQRTAILEFLKTL